MANAATIIKKDHDRIEKELQGDGDKAADDVIAHLGMEAQVLYPALRREVEGGDEIADRAEALVDEIQEAFESGGVKAAFEKHARFDEKEVLPKLEKVLSDTDMENLGEQLEAFKEGQASA